MKKIIDMLMFKMKSKNIMPLMLPGLVKDVLTIMFDADSHTLQDVNQQLVQMGWQQDVLDTDSFELILRIIETQSNYRVIRQNLHAQ